MKERERPAETWKRVKERGRERDKDRQKERKRPIERVTEQVREGRKCLCITVLPDGCGVQKS